MLGILIIMVNTSILCFRLCAQFLVMTPVNSLPHATVLKSGNNAAIITITGFFHPEPFKVEEVKAPSQEVPLISVKIANKGEENTKAKNEPFGQSGTRCTLFDPTSEEPIGVSEYSHSWYRFVRQFKCRVSGQREGGRYNMSVSLPISRSRIPTCPCCDGTCVQHFNG
jgi:hypothetical protein